MCRLQFFLVLFFSFDRLQAQVPVHEEPRHRPVFQNERLRILDVRLPPGDTTQYHLHHTPSLFLFFTSTTTGSQLQGAASSTGRSVAGTFLFEDLASPHERLHRFWNTDTDTFHVMDIELLSKDTGFAQKPLTLPHLQLAIDTPGARVYNLVLETGNNFVIQQSKRSLVLVAMTAGQVQLSRDGREAWQSLQPGSFFSLSVGQSFALKNTGHTIRFTVLEVPGA